MLNTEPKSLQISKAFYGREQPIQILNEAFRWAALGATELVLVSGAPGIGKSSLVLEAFRPAVAGKCYFAWAKLDPYTQKKPYEAIIRCLQFLIRQLLTEPEAVLDKWKARIGEAVGANGALIVEAIPEAELLLGKLPEADPLPAKEAHHRFERVFLRFVRCFTRSEYPLVLFLDDMQWADRTTLQLLDALIHDPENQYLCVIGAFRDREWTENADICESWLRQQSSGVSVRLIAMEPLEFAHVRQLIAETLDCDPEYGFPLAHALYAKSVGNPFYLKRLLQSAADERMVRYDRGAGRWVWDMDRLQAFPGIDGQIEHLIERINRLPPDSRQLLLSAACLGGKVESELLMAVCDRDGESLEGHLAPALHAGLLATGASALRGGAYYFTHDRVHQAAYTLLDDQERMRIHLAAGLHYLARYDREQAESLLFDLTHYLNQAEKLLNAEQRERMVQLNERSAGKAMASADYEMAMRYCDRAIGYLYEDGWSRRQEQAFRLFLRAAECAYLCGHYEAAEQKMEAMLHRAKDWIQRAQAVKLKIDQHCSQGNYREAIALGLEALRGLGIRIEERPAKRTVRHEIYLANRLLRRRLRELYALPDVGDERIRLLTELIVSLIGPAFFANREVLAVISARLIRLMFRHGAPESAPAVFAAFGMVLTTMTGDLMGGYSLGNCAVELADRSGAASLRTKVYVMHYCVIAPWIRTDEQHERKLWEASMLGLEAGDYIFGSYAIGGLINLTYARHPMQRIHKTMRQCLQIAEQTKEELVHRNVLLYMRLAEKWKASTVADFILTDGRDSEAEFLDELNGTGSGAVTLYQFHTYKTQLLCLFGKYEEAIQSARLADPYEGISVRFPHQPILYFYEALAIAAVLRQSPPPRERKELQKRLAKRCKAFARWARIAPGNFKRQLLLLQAERRRGRGPESELFDLYDQAVGLAREAGDAQYVAAAAECAAKHHAEKGRTRLAASYFAEAFEAYRAWGAMAKLERMKKENPELFRLAVSGERLHAVSPRSPESSSAEDEGENWRRMAKEAFVLSEHMDFEAARHRIVAHMLHISAAEYACLITPRGRELWVEPLTGAGGAELRAGVQPLEQSEAVPRTLVRYIWRTGRPIHLDRAAWDELFQHDPYIRRHRGGPISCLPIHAQEKLVGSLYLELSPSAGPLSPERADMLRMLASQTLFVGRLSETFGEGEATEAEEEEPNAGLSESRNADTLTEREFEVLHLMSTGLTNKEIAIRLGVTAGTVKVHMHNIFNKLKVNRRTKAVAAAIKMNLLEPQAMASSADGP